MLILQAVSDEETRGPVNYYLVPQTTLEAFHILTDNQECNNNNELCLAIYKSQKLDADELRFYKLQVRVTVSLYEYIIIARRSAFVFFESVNYRVYITHTMLSSMKYALTYFHIRLHIRVFVNGPHTANHSLAIIEFQMY